MIKNKYGLSRYIPTKIRRIIRQQSGFGCIFCGFAISHCEHVDPEFSEAKEHDPDYMTFLCGHCNDKKMRGILSKEAVKRAMLNPKCIQKGFTFDAFDVGINLPSIQFIDSTWNANKAFILLRINGTDLLRFEPPEEKGNPFLLSAQFYNNKGKRFFWIERNEWFGDINNWEIEAKGNLIMIRNNVGKYSLEIRNIPNDRLIINRINMIYKGYKIKGDKHEGITILFPNGKKYFTIKINTTCSGAEVTAFEIEENKINIAKVKGGPSSIKCMSIGYLGHEKPKKI